MVLIDRDIAVEQFDYWRVAGDLAILRLLTSVGTSLGGPSAAQLVVDPGPDGDQRLLGPCLRRRARATAARRPVVGQPAAVAGEIRRPLHVLEAPQARFRLTAGAEPGADAAGPVAARRRPRALALTQI